MSVFECVCVIKWIFYKSLLCSISLNRHRSIRWKNVWITSACKTQHNNVTLRPWLQPILTLRSMRLFSLIITNISYGEKGTEWKQALTTELPNSLIKTFMYFSWKLILLPIYCILNVWLCDSLSRGLPQRLIICFWINTNVSDSFSCVWIWKITKILKNNFRKCWESIIEQHDFNLQIILQLFYNTRSRLKCSYECKKKNQHHLFQFSAIILEYLTSVFFPVPMSPGWKPSVALGPAQKSILHCGNETTNCLQHNKAVLWPYLQLHCCQDWFKLPLIIANII